MFRNSKAALEPVGFAHAYAEALKDLDIIDNFIQNADLQDLEVSAASKYAFEEMERNPDKVVVGDTVTHTGNGLRGYSVEIMDLENENHVVSSIGRSAIATESLEEDVLTKVNGVVWEGHPDEENDRDPMEREYENLVSGFNSAGMRNNLDQPYREAARNAVGTVDPNSAYTNGFYDDNYVDGLERVGRAVLDLTGQNQMDRELVNKVRGIGNAVKETLWRPEDPNDRQEYLIRPAENEYERQDRYTIPHTDDLVIENLDDAFP